VTRGRFITLEGGEGVGKSTQATHLADFLRAAGHAVVQTREPGGTAGAEAIRELLMSGTVDRWSPTAEVLLFAAARVDHVEKVVAPALERGAWVVCDRYVDSTRAYQGGASGVPDATVLQIHALAAKGLMPDRTLLLHLPPEEAARRAEARAEGNNDRFGLRDTAYHAALSATFDRLAAEEPLRFRRIDASGPAEAVTQALIGAIGDLL